MLRFADLLDQNAEELALLETLDMGKPISDALNVDVPCALTPSVGVARQSTRFTTKWPRHLTTS
jgi:acyl-CoA reductase-like NAD-dependent aldehyde dehydrogenase